MRASALQVVLMVAVAVATLAGTLGLPSTAQPDDSTAYAQTSLPPLPDGWPSTLQLGRSDQPNGAAALRSLAPFGFRYQYLAGGVNTGHGWATWNSDGQFVSYYIDESKAASITPVFTYYMLLQSSPATGSGEQDKDLNNLKNTSTMQAYWADLKLFFQRAGAFPNTRVVLHVEPDLWGYIQQKAASDNAATIEAKVGSTGVAELAGLPDNAAGFAQGIVRLRNQYAPNVLLGYHVSVWGTNVDISISDPPDDQVNNLGSRAARFYQSLGASFDLAFGEFSDRDSAFKQAQYGAGQEAWWDANDFRRHALFISRFVAETGKRMVLWQIPLGNTKMRAMNNTWDHYQDNRPEWLLDDPSRAHLNTYIQAGVIAFLFGRGADGATDASDASGDHVTNPAPINGNTLTSLSADDDGGFFNDRAKSYYTTGAITLPNGSTQSTPTPTSTAPTIPTTTATPTPTPTSFSCTPRPRVSVQSVPGGGRLQVTVSASGQGNQVQTLRFTRTTNTVVDINGQSGRTGAFTVDLPAGTTSTTFAVRRSGAGAGTVSLTVVDRCGDWPTFVGGGAGAF
jgi:hypothetical protein